MLSLDSMDRVVHGRSSFVESFVWLSLSLCAVSKRREKRKEESGKRKEEREKKKEKKEKEKKRKEERKMRKEKRRRGKKNEEQRKKRKHLTKTITNPKKSTRRIVTS